MKITVPEDLRGFAYDRVLPVEFNGFDVDILLPSVFFKVLSDGKDRGRINNDPAQISHYIDELANHPRVKGFVGEHGRRSLERLVRSTLIQTARQGTSRRTEQIQGFTGYTLLTAKPGFPVASSTLRKVDQLIYRMMREQFGGGPELRKFFIQIFGRGLDPLLHGIEIDGTYDGHTDLDTLTLLAIDFLDGFRNTGVKQRDRERPVREACPPIAQAMARDLRRYLQAYHSRMPVEALTYHLKALINFELLIYSVKLFSAVATLVDNRQTLPPAMDPNPNHEIGATKPQIYLDFTGTATGLNRQMAVASVRDCLDLVQRFVHANLFLRQLDRYVRTLRNSRRGRQQIEDALADDMGGPAYLFSLLRLLDDNDVAREIDASARRDLEAISRDNLPRGKEDDDLSETEALLLPITGPATSDFEAVVLLLVEGQGQKIYERVVKWFWSVGGLTKPHGLLMGTTKGKGRHGWRFAPSNDLLATLVQLAAVNIGHWDKDDPAPRPMPLSNFLHFLEDRFGILIDRPPDRLVGAEYAAAASENLRALLRRLSQMGVFRDLSDDFTVQRLIPPYAAEREEMPA